MCARLFIALIPLAENLIITEVAKQHDRVFLVYRQNVTAPRDKVVLERVMEVKGKKMTASYTGFVLFFSKFSRTFPGRFQNSCRFSRLQMHKLFVVQRIFLREFPPPDLVYRPKITWGRTILKEFKVAGIELEKAVGLAQDREALCA